VREFLVPKRHFLRHLVIGVQMKDTVGPIDAILAEFFAGKNPMEAGLDIENHRYVLDMISFDSCSMMCAFQVLEHAEHWLQMSCLNCIPTSLRVDCGSTCTA
jgi:hypothetical protein